MAAGNFGFAVNAQGPADRARCPALDEASYQNEPVNLANGP
jgi:hypothetical protein